MGKGYAVVQEPRTQLSTHIGWRGWNFLDYWKIVCIFASLKINDMVNKELLKTALAEYEERLKTADKTRKKAVLNHYINMTNELLETKE